jgi:hypothetical protein
MIKIFQGLGAFLLSTLVLIGCGQKEEKPFSNPTQIEQYFPLKAFIEERLPEMEGWEVEKHIRLGENEEESRQRFDQEDWRRELDIFVHADINKASLADAYQTEESGNTTIHSLKEGEKGEIKLLKAFRGEGNQVVDSIHFVREKSTLFYSSVAEGTLVMKEGQIHSYRINGEQKVWFLPYNRMEVKGRVIR